MKEKKIENRENKILKTVLNQTLTIILSCKIEEISIEVHFVQPTCLLQILCHRILLCRLPTDMRKPDFRNIFKRSLTVTYFKGVRQVIT